MSCVEEVTSPLPPVIVKPSIMKSTPGRPMPPGEKITALRPWPALIAMGISPTEAPAPAPRTWVLGKTKIRSR